MTATSSTSCAACRCSTGLDRRPARASSPRPARRSTFAPGDELFRRGRSRPTSGGCCSTARSTWSGGSGTRRPWSATMDVRRASGPAASGPGTRNGVYLATGRASAPGRLLRVPAERAAASWRSRGSRSASTCIEGLCRRPRATSSRRPASASRWSRSAPSPPGWRTRSTTRPPPRPARSTRSSRRCDDLLASLRRLAEAGITAEPVRRARRAAPRARAGAGAAPTRWPLADREDELSDWLDRPRASTEDWLIAPPLAARRRRRRLVRAGRPRRSAGPALEPGLDWVASSLIDGRACSPRSRSRPGGSPTWSPRCKSYSQLDRASVQRIDVTEGLESTLVDAGAQARGRRHRRARATPPTCPEIEAIPGELNQVWTNLIDNAVDAMDGAGTLRVVDRGPTATTSWSRSPTPAPACPTRSPPTPSSRSSPPRTSARAPARPRHLAPDRRRAPRRRHHRGTTRGRDGLPGPAPGVRGLTPTEASR